MDGKSRSSIRQALYRIRKKGYITQSDEDDVITVVTSVMPVMPVTGVQHSHNNQPCYVDNSSEGTEDGALVQSSGGRNSITSVCWRQQHGQNLKMCVGRTRSENASMINPSISDLLGDPYPAGR
jgi:hypothetical protein